MVTYDLISKASIVCSYHGWYISPRTSDAILILSPLSDKDHTLSDEFCEVLTQKLGDKIFIVTDFKNKSVCVFC